MRVWGRGGGGVLEGVRESFLNCGYILRSAKVGDVEKKGWPSPTATDDS